jgi:hypothetical protein
VNNVGILVFLETHRRIGGVIPDHLSKDAFSMAGYCIDATDTLLCGSIVFDQFGPGTDDWLALPSFVLRDGA